MQKELFTNLTNMSSAIGKMQQALGEGNSTNFRAGATEMATLIKEFDATIIEIQTRGAPVPAVGGAPVPALGGVPISAE